MNDGGGGLLMVAVIVAGIVMQFRGDTRCREHIERWAQDQGMTVRSIRRRWVFKGPFWIRSSNVQRIYDVDVIDRRGVARQGIARVGGWFSGALAPRVDVEWR